MSQSKNPNQNHNANSNAPNQEQQPIPIDGFKQVLEMLRIADPAFRESLLRRLAQRDKDLANSLRRDLSSLDY